ncbi:MAG: Lrp/AsnC family transcriptional regulator [Emcibacteraceae bacterium]|nr:Lrp/AsnC family transcriptional regulator [Emcibacteraceae bacterium]
MIITTTDRKVLNVLQKYPSLSQNDLAEKANMSRSSFWRHIKDMEDAGVIGERIPDINASMVGLKIKANCVISIKNHISNTREQFEKHIENIANVLECYATAGGKDYMLTVVAKDIDDYYEMMSTSILDHPTIDSAQTSFFMKKIKSTRRLPL